MYVPKFEVLGILVRQYYSLSIISDLERQLRNSERQHLLS